MIACDCSTCRSNDPRDRRLRTSVLVQLDDGASVLVDAGPDLRAQALAHDIRRVDAVLFTHGHADHVLGLDETRRWTALQRAPLPCYGDAETIAALRQTFSYIFSPPPDHGGSLPALATFVLGGAFCLGPQEIVPVPVYHGRRPILGFRIGGFAYLTDCSRIPDESWPLLDGLDLLVLDALRERPHPTHFSLSEAVAAAERIGPRRTCFTHLCHDLPHASTSARLPRGMELAYDGLVVTL